MPDAGVLEHEKLLSEARIDMIRTFGCAGDGWCQTARCLRVGESEITVRGWMRSNHNFRLNVKGAVVVHTNELGLGPRVENNGFVGYS